MKRKSYINKWTIVLVSVCIFILAAEVYLRVELGFCHAVLFREDKDFEYIPIPQQTKRLGNNIFYNSFSQRNEEISSKDSVVVLGFGDSVLNGGTQVDQDSLATTKLSRYLSSKAADSVKVLNVSSGSWGPDNCYAYLKKYGDFKARSMFLVMSSHDVYDTMSFEKIVGVNPSFPEKQYPFALYELVDKYLLPKLIKRTSKNTSKDGRGIDKKTENSVFNPGISNLYQYAKSKNIPFLIYLHADRDEFDNKRYSEEGQLLITFCNENNIPLVKELDYNIGKEAYRDGIHLTDLGQGKMFEILKDKITY